MMERFAHITGWGMALPERILTNEELARTVDTTDAWIRERTGIRQRHIAGHDQTTASLGTQAAAQAIRTAGLNAIDVDLIIVATSSPDHLLPATACIIQHDLEARKAGAFDLLAACTGFIYALHMAAQAIRTGAIHTAVVIGAETLSRMVDWQDRNTCILFGDGAGAFVLQASDIPGGVRAGLMKTDGSGRGCLSIPAGGSCLPTSHETVTNGQHFIQMDGRAVYRFATRTMPRAIREVVRASGLTLDDIQAVIPHQANRRIIEASAHQVGLPIDRFVINVERYGNTSTASIPIATCEAAAAGRLQAGDPVVLVGFGAGLSWGAVVAEWTASTA
jgi:3-oxoacyl-[acyl-carrier-protein] synthase-3